MGLFCAKSLFHQYPKTPSFPGFFSQVPETRVLKFCPELETLLSTPGVISNSDSLVIVRSSKVFEQVVIRAAVVIVWKQPLLFKMKLYFFAKLS